MKDIFYYHPHHHIVVIYNIIIICIVLTHIYYVNTYLVYSLTKSTSFLIHFSPLDRVLQQSIAAAQRIITRLNFFCLIIFNATDDTTKSSSYPSTIDSSQLVIYYLIRSTSSSYLSFSLNHLGMHSLSLLWSPHSHSLNHIIDVPISSTLLFKGPPFRSSSHQLTLSSLPSFSWANVDDDDFGRI